MKILLLTKYPARGPSSRYRFYQYLPALAEAGHECLVRPLFTDRYLSRLFADKPAGAVYLAKRFTARLAQCVGARSFDLAWIEGELIPFVPAMLERGLHALLPKRRVYEFDDAVWLRYAGKRRLENKFRNLLGDAAGIVAGNRFLADYARSVNPRVCVVPTVVDWRKYEDARPKMSGGVVGWIGSQNTVFYLRELVPALRRVAERRPLEVAVVGARFEAEGLNIREEAWSADREIALLSQFDVGVMPLAVDPWSEGKCGLKLLQYLAAGVPAVASPVGVNADFIRSSGGGLLASDSDQWADALERLLDDASLRRDMGARGRTWARREMTVQAQAPRLIAFLEQCAAGEPAPRAGD